MPSNFKVVHVVTVKYLVNQFKLHVIKAVLIYWHMGYLVKYYNGLVNG